MKKTSLVILAAGIGSRYGGLKQLEAVGPAGALLLDYSVYDAKRAGFGRIVFVISRRIEEDFKKFIGSRYIDSVDVDYVFQELQTLVMDFKVPQFRQKPWGTGHAVLSAYTHVHQPFAVINADDYYGPQSYVCMHDFLKTKNRDSKEFAMVGFQVQQTLSAHGKVSRGICNVDAGCLVSIVERERIYTLKKKLYYDDTHNHTSEIMPDSLVSMNLWGFAPDTLFPILQERFKVFLKEQGCNPKAEFYLPSAINYAIQAHAIKVTILQTPEQWFGLTYPEDKAIVKARILEKVRNGVYPEKLF